NHQLTAHGQNLTSTPQTLSASQYCNKPLPCVFWGANEKFLSDNAGATFLKTRAIVRHTPPPGCNFLTPSTPSDRCIFNEKTTPFQIISNQPFIGDIENSTLMIEHSIRGGKATTIAVLNGLMDGKLKASDGKMIVKSWTNATRMDENPYADGDVVKVADLLTAADADLDAPSTVAKRTDLRDKFAYVYLPRVIDGNKYKAVESLYQSDGSYILKRGMAFDCGYYHCEVLMLNIVPEKRTYEKAKFEVTDGFDSMRHASEKRLDNETELV
ncbi:9715_t:CDS:2, partial [Paraglomus occultum]